MGRSKGVSKDVFGSGYAGYRGRGGGGRRDILPKSHPEPLSPNGGDIFPRYPGYAPERKPPVEQRDSGTRGKESGY